jgi:hypothetical protein
MALLQHYILLKSFRYTANYHGRWAYRYTRGSMNKHEHNRTPKFNFMHLDFIPVNGHFSLRIRLTSAKYIFYFIIHDFSSAQIVWNKCWSIKTGTSYIAICSQAGFLPSLFFNLKMEAICSSETSVYSQLTTRSYIAEDGTLQTTAVRTSNPTKVYFSGTRCLSN